MNFKTSILFLMVVLPAVLSHCGPGPQALYPDCPNWRIGMDKIRPKGVVVHGHASGTLHQSPSGSLQGTVQGSRVFGGPHSGAQTVGGALNYQHNSGLHGGVGASHTRGSGTSYNANVGGSTQLGPGTLSVGGGAAMVPGSSRVQGQVGATYSVPLH